MITTNGGTTIFRGHYFCSPFVFLWAVDFLYRRSETHYGILMFMSPDLEELLCKICLPDPSGLDNVLMMTKRTSGYERSGIFDYGTQGGFGKWILLASSCPVAAIPER